MISQEENLQQKSSENSLENVTFDGYKHKLKGRLFGLLCEREKDGEWEKFLESLSIEL
jgi:hypothetical protein